MFLGLFSPSPADLLIILVLALLFFGAKRLPELARGLGSAIHEFNKAKDDLQHQMTQTVEPPPAAPVPPTSAAPAPATQQPVAPATPVQPVAQQPAQPVDPQPKA